ncbi:hypothetical protein K0M31_017507 [Melipona bicolor]|uniref:Uncharacterized protein n=1 Tax=Melipona bicolor TaxID=60889 RepID=A0AA40KSI0_9HYME|nr:hypothetical protein K0M31_017507 [Melipona bicolor]
MTWEIKRNQFSKLARQNETRRCPTGLSPRRWNTGNSIKPKQWRLNDPIKSGQDKAIRVALIVIGTKQAPAEKDDRVARRNGLHRPVEIPRPDPRPVLAALFPDARRGAILRGGEKAVGALAREKRERVRK